MAVSIFTAIVAIGNLDDRAGLNWWCGAVPPRYALLPDAAAVNMTNEDVHRRLEEVVPCVDVLGPVPQSLPVPRIPNLSHWPELLHGSLVVAIVGFSLVVATGKVPSRLTSPSCPIFCRQPLLIQNRSSQTFGEKNGYEIDPNQELLAVGLANIVGGCICSYPASSSLSRSALANEIGSRTPLYNVFACIVIIITLLLFSPLLYRSSPVHPPPRPLLRREP